MREKQGREALKLYIVEGFLRAGVGGGGAALEVERSSSAVREGCNAETCQKRAPGPPFGMWPVCLPRKYRAVEREEKGKRGQRHVLPHR